MAGASPPSLLMAFSQLSSLPSFTSLSATTRVKSMNLTDSCSGCGHALFSGQSGAQRLLFFKSRKTIKIEKLKLGRVLVASDSRDPSSNSSIRVVVEAPDNNDVGNIPLVDSNSKVEDKAIPSDAQDRVLVASDSRDPSSNSGIPDVIEAPDNNDVGSIPLVESNSKEEDKAIPLDAQGRVLVASDSRDPSLNSGIPGVIEAPDNNIGNIPAAPDKNVGNIPLVESNSKEEAKAISSDAQSSPRKYLTAREKLRAARVLSKYNESKPSKSEMGSSVLDALKESDKGKRRSRLPEAPSNLFDDSKRGLPKQGLTFNFPGGNDLLQIAVSFVLISSIMFGTTYIVWKVGAIHFNEY